jgi:hypothetical protein
MKKILSDKMNVLAIAAEAVMLFILPNLELSHGNNFAMFAARLLALMPIFLLKISKDSLAFVFSAYIFCLTIFQLFSGLLLGLQIQPISLMNIVFMLASIALLVATFKDFKNAIIRLHQTKIAV